MCTSFIVFATSGTTPVGTTHEFVYVCLFCVIFFCFCFECPLGNRMYGCTYSRFRLLGGEKKSNNLGNNFQGVFVKATLTTPSNTIYSEIYSITSHLIRTVFYIQIFIQIVPVLSGCRIKLQLTYFINSS